MISFRYHVVSTIAVFLGIVLGVVVGTTALNGAVVGDLRRQVSDLKSDKAKADDANKALGKQANNANVLAQTYGQNLVAGKLANVPVVFVIAPGAPEALVRSAAGQIQNAGGTIAGVVTLNRDLIDPRRASDVRTLVTSGVHPMGLTLPTTDDAGRLAGALLGFVLLGKGQATDLTQALTGLATLNMLKASGNTASGRAIVFVSSGHVDGDSGLLQNLSSLAGQLGLAGPTVVAGDASSATSGGLIAALRGSGAARKVVSTVDDADGALGQVTVALATADALAGHNGQYGTTGDVDALVPGAAQ